MLDLYIYLIHQATWHKTLPGEKGLWLCVDNPTQLQLDHHWLTSSPTKALGMGKMCTSSVEHNTNGLESTAVFISA